MLTYLEVFKALPPVEEKAEPALPTKIVKAILMCVAASGLLCAGAWYVNSNVALYGAIALLGLTVVAAVVYVIHEVRRFRKWMAENKHLGIVQLDQRIEREKAVVAGLTKLPLPELKWMTQRLEMEATIRERWLDVLKPFSMLVPAALVIVSINTFHLPAFIQDWSKLLGGFMLVGLTIGAISIYKDIVQIRRLAPMIHCAIVEIEGKRAPSFRKVSRRRGQA